MQCYRFLSRAALIIAVAVTVCTAGSASANDPDAKFDFWPRIAVVGYPVQFVDDSRNDPGAWLWEFDDGATSTEQNPVHTFERDGRFEVRLTVVNLDGEDDEVEEIDVVLIGRDPVASFAFTPAQPGVGLPVQFTDASEGFPTSWEWTFDDGGTSTEQNPVHVFDEEGSYEIELTVSNSAGLDDAKQRIEVTMLVEEPVAVISHRPAYPVVGQTVKFFGSSKGGPGTSWEWEFDDGESSTEQNPWHTFASAGSYEVELAVTNSVGTDDQKKKITVFEEGPTIKEAYLVPAASYSTGDEDSFFQTDLDLNNLDDRIATYSLLWLPRDADNSSPSRSENFTIAAGASAKHDNALAGVFGLEPDVNGALVILADTEHLVIMTRTYSRKSAKVTGTFGQAIVGEAVPQLITTGEVGRIIFMNEDPGFRANVGCANATGESVQILVDLYDQDGLFLETKTMDLQAWSNSQLNRVFAAYAPIHGFVDVRTAKAGAAFTCYGSVLDNDSNDPMTVPPAVRQP